MIAEECSTTAMGKGRVFEKAELHILTAVIFGVEMWVHYYFWMV